MQPTAHNDFIEGTIPRFSPSAATDGVIHPLAIFEMPGGIELLVRVHEISINGETARTVTIGDNLPPDVQACLKNSYRIYSGIPNVGYPTRHGV